MSLESYSTLGRTGLKISRLSLGTMTFGTEWGWGSEKATAKALFDQFVDAGGNVFDLRWPCGPAHRSGRAGRSETISELGDERLFIRSRERD